MANEKQRLEHVAISRREQWREHAEQAAARGDSAEAFISSRFVSEYESFIAEFRRESSDESM